MLNLVASYRRLLWTGMLAALLLPSAASAQHRDACDCNAYPARTQAPCYQIPQANILQPESSAGSVTPFAADAPPSDSTSAAIDQAFSQAPSLNFSERGSAFTGSTFAALDSAPGGYIEMAQIRSNFRFRFEAAYDFDRPDRAEFY